MTLRGKRVLVTGGTGFIGGRVVEKLVLECNAHVRVLVRNFAHAGRIARFPLEMINGDVTDIEAVRRAVEGCDVIFHCAYGNTGTPMQQRAVTVCGTEILAQAALRSGTRMVHASTISVYGRTGDGDLDETASRKRSGDVYADAKLKAEQLVLNYHRKHGLAVVVVQPTIVYGPFGSAWTVGPINQVKRERVVLVNGGDGLCNAVYVDDVVDAMVLAATESCAVGEAYLISGEQPVTWREFYAAYEKMLGVESTLSMSVDEIRRYIRRQGGSSTVAQVLRVLREKPNIRSRLCQLPLFAGPYRFLRSVLPDTVWQHMRHRVLDDQRGAVSLLGLREKPIHLPSEAQISLFGSKTRVCITKAKRQLGFSPRYDFDRGMCLTAQWAKWANLS